MANKFEDLICWQLSSELKREVLALTAKPPASRDFEFCDQIRNSPRSAPRNIAEAFGRYYPSESHPFYQIALGSLNETLNHLIDAQDNKWLDDDEFLRLKRLNLRAIKATKEMVKYQESEEADRFNRK